MTAPTSPTSGPRRGFHAGNPATPTGATANPGAGGVTGETFEDLASLESWLKGAGAQLEEAIVNLEQVLSTTRTIEDRLDSWRPDQELVAALAEVQSATPPVSVCSALQDSLATAARVASAHLAAYSEAPGRGAQGDIARFQPS